MSLMEKWAHTNLLVNGDPDIYEGKTLPELKTNAVMALAKALDGLSADNPEDFLSHVASPGTTNKQLRKDMLKMSGCALTALGLWRELGVTDRVIWDSYRVGMAVVDVINTAKEHKAWHNKLKPGTQPFQIGDVVYISMPEHVFTVVSEPTILEMRNTPNGGEIEKFRFDALHGGRVTKTGKQLIEIAPTTATWQENKLVISGTSPATGFHTKPREVGGIARTMNLELGKDAFLPEGWNV